MPVAPGSMIKCIFVQPIYQRDLTKNSTRDFSNRCKKIDTIKTSCRPPQPTTGLTIIFFNKERQLGDSGGGSVAAAEALRRQLGAVVARAAAAWWSGSVAAVAVAAAA